MAQIYSHNGFNLGQRDRSYSSNFSKNPDDRKKNEVSPQERKKRQREKDHEKSISKVIQKRGSIEPLIDTQIQSFSENIECSCLGQNANCCKCFGLGIIKEQDINDKTYLIPPLQTKNTDSYSAKIKITPYIKEKEIKKSKSSKQNLEAIYKPKPRGKIKIVAKYNEKKKDSI